MFQYGSNIIFITYHAVFVIAVVNISITLEQDQLYNDGSVTEQVSSKENFDRGKLSHAFYI